jgi:uncharacterized membrane protein
MLNELSIIGITLIAAIVAAGAQYLFKRSVPKFDLGKRGIKALLFNRGIWAGVVIYLISLVIYLKALGSGQLSFVYPTFASTFVFVTLISHFALKEEMSMKRIAGIAMIVMGIAIVALTY